MKFVLTNLFLLLAFYAVNAQNIKPQLVEEDIQFIQHAFNSIVESDQFYRPILQAGTFNKEVLARLDSLYEGDDVQAVFTYMTSIKKDMTATERDSLLELQRNLDFINHMIIRGIWDRYGWVSKELVKENNYVQSLLLLHPPCDLDQIPEFLENYKQKLLPEVEAGRMPAMSYASFVDNIRAKILRQPQLYGTNGAFDPKTKTILAPAIADLALANKERKVLGLPELKEGEYRIADVE